MATKLKETTDCFKYDGNVILTPYKYNGGQNYKLPKMEHKTPKKLLIGVDWFQCTVNGSFLKDSSNPSEVLSFSDGDIVLVKDELRPNGTKDYKKCYNIYLHGESFGFVLTSPRSSVLDEKLSNIKLYNHILYQRGWVARLEFVMKELGVVLNNITRLDIAVDGGDFLADYQAVGMGMIDLIGRAKRSTEHRGNELEGFYVGSRSSDKYIKGYNKTKELEKAGNKQYIKDFWSKNGLPFGEGAKDVERLELTLKRKSILRIKDFDFGRLEDASYLAGLMESQIQKLYVFVDRDSDKNVSRKTKIQPVEWSYFDAEKVERLPKVDAPSVVWAAQQSISFEMRESYAGLGKTDNNLFSQAYSRCYDRAKKYGVLEWFERKLSKWEKDKKYHELMRTEFQKVRRSRFNKVGNSAVFTSM